MEAVDEAVDERPVDVLAPPEVTTVDCSEVEVADRLIVEVAAVVEAIFGTGLLASSFIN